MTAAQIFRDWRAGMIAAATLLHLTAFAGAWALIPAGTQTRLNRPIEASFAPAPSSDAVNADSAPLAQTVVSESTEPSDALEDTAEIVPPDAVKAEAATPVTQQSVKPDQVAAHEVPSAKQPDVSPESVAVDPAPADPAITATPPPTVTPAVPQQTAALVPDVLTTTSTEQTTSVPLVPSQDGSTQDSPVTPAIPKPEPRKPVKSAHATLPRKKMEPPAKPQPETKRLAKLDTKTSIRRAQNGGSGAISDIGVAADARISGATTRAYAAILQAAFRSRVRAMGDIGCKAGAKTSVSVVVSTMGRIGSVRLASASGDPALDRAAVLAVRSTSLPTAPIKAVAAVIPLTCPRT